MLGFNIVMLHTVILRSLRNISKYEDLVIQRCNTTKSFVTNCSVILKVYVRESHRHPRSNRNIDCQLKEAKINLQIYSVPFKKI